MLTPLKLVGKEYKTLIVKMAIHSGYVEGNKTNLVNLCDVGTILGLSCILPMLKSLNVLMKFAQARVVFVCDYIVVVEIYCIDLYKMYIDSTTSFDLKNFLNSQMLLQTFLVRLLKIG
jgi:hypothetical protein